MLRVPVPAARRSLFFRAIIEDTYKIHLFEVVSKMSLFSIVANVVRREARFQAGIPRLILPRASRQCLDHSLKHAVKQYNLFTLFPQRNYRLIT